MSEPVVDGGRLIRRETFRQDCPRALVRLIDTSDWTIIFLLPHLELVHYCSVSSFVIGPLSFRFPRPIGQSREGNMYVRNLLLKNLKDKIVYFCCRALNLRLAALLIERSEFRLALYICLGLLLDTTNLQCEFQLGH
jgi:hypothetical protein